MAVEVPYKPKGTPKIEFVEYNGAKFRTIFWSVPEGVENKGRIVYVHGFAEHGELYTQFFDDVTQLGYEVFFFDQRGAGETSPGDLVGKTDEFHTFDDLDFFIKQNVQQLKEQESESHKKVYLVGHSMGGAIVLNYGIRGKYIDDIRGIVSSGPLIKLHPKSQPNIILRGLQPVINKLVPNMKFDSSLNFDYITSNEAWKNYIVNHDKKLIGTIRQFHDMFVRGDQLLIPDLVKKFNPKVPVLVIHGDKDYINDIEGSAKFIKLLPEVVDKKFVRNEGGRHSNYLESEKIYKVALDSTIEFFNSY
ncbi:Monoglyceride lipase [Spathaspora sp. JA1]|nr:Monoglyceride lipase [Spathaspora sp. JA1]